MGKEAGSQPGLEGRREGKGGRGQTEKPGPVNAWEDARRLNPGMSKKLVQTVAQGFEMFLCAGGEPRQGF